MCISLANKDHIYFKDTLIKIDLLKDCKNSFVVINFKNCMQNAKRRNTVEYKGRGSWTDPSNDSKA